MFAKRRLPLQGRSSRAFERCIAILAVSTVAVAWGCAAGSYAGFRQDADVTRMFETNAVPPEYRYYTTGRSDLPYAIVGIAPQYRLTTDYWQPVEPNTASFARKVDFTWTPDVWYRIENARGAWITDPQGRNIGIWYSKYPYTTVTVTDDGHVEVYSPYLPE